MLEPLVLVTAAVTLVACAPVLALLRRAGRYDVPNGRSSHSAPTPRGGGLAVLAGCGAGCAVTVVALGGSWDVTTWTAVVAAAALAAVGLADDLRGINVLVRLLSQVAVGLLAGAVMGGVVGALLGGIAVPAAVNMVNFMDGINGLCAGHAVVWGVGAVAASRAAGGSQTLLVLGALSIGGGLGFLPWNVPSARLFLGDVGSYFFGALAGMGMVACLALTKEASGALTTATVVGLVCAPYFLFSLDTSVTIMRRLAVGEPVFVAHRSHVYQRLVNDVGFPHWVVSAVMAAASLLITVAVAWRPVAGLGVAAAIGTAYLLSPHLRRVAVSA